MRIKTYVSGSNVHYHYYLVYADSYVYVGFFLGHWIELNQSFTFTAFILPCTVILFNS